MVSSFSRVDGLPQTHNLVRHGAKKTDSALIRQVVCRCWSVSALSCDRRNNSEVRRVLTVLVPTVHPQMNSELHSWWFAHGTTRHRHMTNSTMDFSGTPDNDFD